MKMSAPSSSSPPRKLFGFRRIRSKLASRLQQSRPMAHRLVWTKIEIPGNDKIWRMLLEARVDRPVTEVEAVRLAREFYGLEATAKALPGEYDDNFQLTAADGKAFVLKVMHPAREHSFIDLQCQALRHLAQHAPQLPLPRVTANRRGELFASMTAADGSTRRVWLLTFLNGKILSEVRPHSPELLGDLGRFLGEMDAALQSFTHAAAHRELKWDFSRAGWIKEHVKQIADSKRRALVEQFLALYEAEVIPKLPHLRL